MTRKLFGTDGVRGVANREPIRVQFDLENLTVCCSCSSRQRPCNHGPALYLRWLQMPEIFRTDSPPDWLQTAEAGVTSANSTASAKWAAVEQGLSELELWLHDLIRAGLAAGGQFGSLFSGLCTRRTMQKRPNMARRPRVFRRKSGVSDNGSASLRLSGLATRPCPRAHAHGNVTGTARRRA